MEPWYKVVTLRKEVREGRSFSPDEFAIALEQVLADTAPEDYRDPAQFFSRTLLYPCAEGTRRHGAPATVWQDREHGAGPYADHPIRRRQDAHSHLAVPPGQGRSRGLQAPRRVGSLERGRDT